MKQISQTEFDFLMGNSTILDAQPHLIKRFNKRQEEMFAFFDKVPENKVMQIMFPDESTWRLYSTRLRNYAIPYKYNLSISARKNEKGYFIYIIKKGIKGETNETKDMEIKSV
jgi:hypothetical protein